MLAWFLNATKDYFTLHLMHFFKKHTQNLVCGFGWLGACDMLIYQIMYQKGRISFRENQLFTNLENTRYWKLKSFHCWYRFSALDTYVITWQNMVGPAGTGLPTESLLIWLSHQEFPVFSCCRDMQGLKYTSWIKGCLENTQFWWVTLTSYSAHFRADM